MEQMAMEKSKEKTKEKNTVSSVRNRYAIHGVPEPLGVDVNHIDMEKAAEILEPGVGENRVLVRYIRDEGQDVRVVAKDENGNIKIYTKKDKGEPHGVLVAFKNGNDVYVGWSKRNSGYVIGEDDEGKKIWVAVEPLRFTKKDALWVATLRGLTDKVVKPDDGPYQTSKGTPIPSQIARKMDKFIARTEKYFGKTPVNLR